MNIEHLPLKSFVYNLYDVQCELHPSFEHLPLKSFDLDDVQCELKSTQDCLEKMKTESEGGKMVILQEEKQQLLVSRYSFILST